MQLEHTDVEEDAAAWDVDIDHTFTPRCDGSGAILVAATITGKLLLSLELSSQIVIKNNNLQGS